MTTKNQEQAKKVTGMTDIPYVSNGVAADISGYVLTEDGLSAMVEVSIANEAAQATIKSLEAKVATAETAKKTAENALVVANATIATNATEKTALETRVAELEEEAGITPTNRAEDTAKKKTVADKYKTSYDEAAELYSKV